MKILTHPDYPGQIIEESDPERIAHMTAQGGWIAKDQPVIIPEEPAPPVRRVWPSGGHLWAELSRDERIALAACNVPEVRALVVDVAVWPGEIWSDHPQVQEGFRGLVAAGLLTVERASVILNPPGLIP